jgi:drug/metabolite transporter (DMT)-like permease
MVAAETLLPCDEHKEERISVYEVETYREDACVDFEDESAVGYTQLPMDSKVEILEGIPGMQWTSTFTKSTSPRLRGILIVNGLNFLYGGNIAVVKETEFSLDPASFSVGRFVIAALVFTPFLKGAFKQPAVAKAGIELGVWASLAYLSQSVGLMTTDAGRVSFFTTFSVLTVPLIAGLAGRKVPLLTWFAVFAALFGVGLLETSGAPPSVGDAWSLLSAVAFGVHLFRTEFHSRDLSSGVAFPIMALQMAVIAAISIMWLFASHLTSIETLLSSATLDWPELNHTLIGLPWVPLLYTGVLTTSICLTLELMAMRDISATEAAVINVLEPLWGAAVAWFALGERWGLRGWVGAAFILCGSLVTQIWGRPEELP